MAVEGSLDLFQLPEILQIISQEQKTGILTVQGQNDIVAISFLEGRVVTADALNQTLEDQLGEVLISRDALRREALEEALVEQRRTGRRLMDVLVAQEMVDRQEVLEALREQTMELLSRLLHWREGEFKFYSGDEVSYEEGFRPIRVESLLLSALGDAADRETSQGEATEPEAEDAAPVEATPQAGGGAAGGETLPSGPAEPGKPAEDRRRATPASSRKNLLPDLEDAALRPRESSQPAETQRPAPEKPRPRSVTVRPPTPQKATARSSATTATPPRTVGRQGLGWALALLAAAGLVAVVLLRPTLLLVPFPFEQEARLAFEDGRWSVRYAQLEAALRTHVLVDGQMPEELGVLVAAGLLAEEDVEGPLGQPLVYEAEGASYSFRPLGAGEDAAFVGTLEGDFLLDPGMLEDESAATVRPLVLLD